MSRSYLIRSLIVKFNKALKKMLIRIDLKDVHNEINFYLVNKNIVSEFTFVAPSLTERDKEENVTEIILS